MRNSASLSSEVPVPSSSPGSPVTRRDGGVTWRAVVLSLLLAAAFGYMIPIIDFKIRNTKLGSGHLPIGAVGVLLVLLLIINPILKVVRGQWALTRNETLTVYITTLFSTLVPGMGSENLFVSYIIAPFYFATRENKWLEFLQPYLKPWFTPAISNEGVYGPAQQEAVTGWFNGAAPSATGVAVPWGVWLVPLLMWGSLVFASYIMLGTLSVMLRAQWGEREALAFPLLKLPMEMTEDVDANNRLTIGKFFGNPALWIGFGVAVFIEGMNGLHFYFSDVPFVPLSFPLGSLFTETPWNQMAPMALLCFPIFVAITFLLTTEVSLSLWLFLWIFQFQYIMAYWAGLPYGTLPPAVGHSGDGVARTFTAFQQVGAYLGYVAILLWTAREHFKYIALRAFGKRSALPAEADEPLSYPMAFWGFVLSFVYLVAWSCLAGMRIDVALALWILYLVTAIALSRAVIEGGVMFINQGWVPLGALAQLFGSGPGRWLGTASLVPGSFLQVTFFQDMRAFIMPSFLHGFKMAHDRKIESRKLWFLIFASIGVSMAAGLWMKVSMGYTSGALTFHPWFATVAARYPAEVSQKLMQGGEAGIGNWFWMGIGIAATVGMMAARARFAWFPLHPIGYLLALTAPVQRAWFSFFLGWAFKVLIVKFGGHDAYKRMIPVALGIILGEVSMILFWLLIDAWQGRGFHEILP